MMIDLKGAENFAKIHKGTRVERLVADHEHRKLLVRTRQQRLHLRA